MKFADYITVYKQKINDAVKSIWDSKIDSNKNSFLKDYYSEIRKYFLAGGKRIRPLLCIATYNAFKEDKDDKIILEVKILTPDKKDEYSGLDQLIGICETGRTDGSLNHDTIIYRGEKSQ